MPGRNRESKPPEQDRKQPLQGTLPLPAHQVDTKHAQHGSQSRRQPGGEFVDSEDRVGRRRQPVVENRLFQPGLSEIARGHKVARDQHFSGDLGVARLIRTHQSQTAQTQKEQDPDEPENQKQVAGFNSPEHVY